MQKVSGVYINGEWGAIDENNLAPVINPANEEVIGYVSDGDEADALAAVAAARDSFDKGSWSELPQRERNAVIEKLLVEMEKREEQFVDLLVKECGSTVAAAKRAQYGECLNFIQSYLDLSLQDFTEAYRPTLSARPDGTTWLGSSVALRTPVGVVTAITANNYPIFIIINKVIPALLMGNSVLLKSSPDTPLVTALFVEAMAEIGLPPGVFNMVAGGPEVGKILTSDERVDMITFTGSRGVGAALMAQGAETLKKLVLELGGKSAFIVREDADMDAAAQVGFKYLVTHAGQACVALTRQLVHNSIKDEYLDRLQAMAKKVVIGDPADPSTMMGPVISAKQLGIIESSVQAGLNEGGELLCGGRRPEHMEKGYYYEPTIFTGLDNSSTVAQEEVFGPVLTVMGYDSDDEAIAIANDSKYGLSGGIHSRDVGRAYQMAERIHGGRILINGGSGRTGPYEPFGGFKQSGLGKEYGVHGLLEFTEQKSIVYHGG